MEQIATGYKPEFGLGAVYSGINAADVEEKNTLDMIKSFLANSRELQAQPMDMDIKGLEAAQARMQNTPELLQGFVDNKQATYDKARRENELGNLLQPHLKQQTPIKGEMDVNKAKQDSNLMELQRTISTETDRDGNPIAPQDIAILNQELQRQVAMRGQTPELYAKMEHERLQGANALERQRLANEGMLAAAGVRGGKGGGDKTYQTYIKLDPKVRIGVLNGALATGINPITQEQMTDTERMMFQNQYDQDVRTVDANARNAGGGLTIGPDKNLVQAPTKSVGGSPITLESQVKASGIAYEPTVYDYRVVDGKVQRKKKE